MIGKFAAIFAGLIVLMAMACSKHDPTPQLVVEIPAGFSGNFVLEMGVPGAAPLVQRGDVYMVTVPRTGRVTTSTFLAHPRVVFKNDSDGRVWGYSQNAFATGDGISVGGKIAFFVGTQKEYEAEQGRKKHSRRFSTAGDLASTEHASPGIPESPLSKRDPKATST